LSIAVEPQAAHKDKLLRILGVGFGLAVTIGAVVGGGTLRMPGIVAGHLNSESLILSVWVFGGLWALLGANIYSEFGTMLPKAGGPYVFLRRAYGDFIGFAGGLNDFAINVCALAYLGISAGEFMGAIFPSLAGSENRIAIFFILALGFLNWLGLKEGEVTQKLTSLIKVVAFFVFIAACFSLGGQTTSLSAAPPGKFDSSFAAFAAVMLAFQVVSEAYAGWNAPVYFSEENTNPSRNIPRSMFGGILTVVVVYVLLNAALLYVLPVAQISASKIPGADAATLIFGGVGGKITTALAVVATLGVLNALILYAPRIPFAMSRDGLLPPQLMRVNKGGTPSAALLLLVVLSIVATLSGSYETFLAMAAFFSLVGDSFVYLALFILRRREPDLPRPYRAWGYPVLPAVVLVGAWVIFIGYVVSNTLNSLLCLGILALLYPLFLVVSRLSKRDAPQHKP
jgi:APA family basic amino acid/polyamine antiporter